jgi:ParB family chromosome partitioning protein
VQTSAVQPATEERFHPALPLERIEPSPTNPRKHLDQTDLEELAKSIKAHGVVQAIVVRPHPSKKDRFEIVVGERRWRASKLAGRPTIPAIERAFDDGAVLEIQIIENLQRKDIHELEEANGYRTLMDRGFQVEAIADKVGKSVKYIYDRMKLEALCPELQKLFYSRELTAGHAILLARLPEPSQKQLLKEGIFATVRDGNQKEDVIVSVRELGRLIKDNVHRDLEKAIFDRKDATLLPAAGACDVCPKRSGSTCLDPSCFNDKFRAFVKAKVDAGQWVAASYDYNKKGFAYWFNLTLAGDRQCPSIKTAIMVDGNRWNQGEKKRVCLDANCKVHRRQQSSSYSAAAANRKRSERKQFAATERAYRTALYQAVDKQIDHYFAAVKGNPLSIAKVPLSIIASQLMHHLDYELEQEILKEFGVKGKTTAERAAKFVSQVKTLPEKQLAAFLVKTALRSEVVSVDEYSKDIAAGAENLHAAAEFYKIDASKLRHQVLAKLQTSAHGKKGKGRKA